MQVTTLYGVNDYGHDIRMARYSRQWTRERLADEAGITVAKVNDIENGEADPTPPVLKALQLVEVKMLVSDLGANFLRILQSTAQEIPKEKMPVVLAAVLDVVGRAAACIDPTPTVGQLNVVAGRADIDQQIG